MKVPFRFFYLFITLGILHVSPCAGISNGEGSCYHFGTKQVSGAVSFSKLGLFAAADFGIHDLVSVGTIAGHNRFTDYRGWKYRRYPVFGKAALHPLNIPFLADLILIRNRIDIYGGVAAGFVYIKPTWYGINPTPIGSPEKSGVKIGQYLGMRFMLNERWQLFVENCGHVSHFSLGVGRVF